ncbi:arylsulfotransferase family protein [Gordonia sp. NPDC003422]
MHRQTLVARIALLFAGVFGVSALLAPDATALPTLPFGTPTYTVQVNRPGGAPGYIFYTSGLAAAVPFTVGGPGLDQFGQANIIVDKSGKEVWRYVPPKGQSVSNFRTQVYQGRKVLTWWQGGGGGGHGEGVNYITDTRGRLITTVTPGRLKSDVHEFRLTPDGRALITSYVPIAADLSSVGGPRNGTILDCVATVIDVATKRVVLQWSSHAHIPVSETALRYGDPRNAVLGSTFDPYHMNSIVLDPSGNLLFSFRNLSAIYNVDIRSGKVNWRLGGKHSDLKLGAGVAMHGQHDAEYAGPNTIRVFDNNITGTQQLGTSSIKWIRLDLQRRTAHLVRAQRHPAGLSAAATGNAQGLSNGNTFGSWGTAPHISEFSPSGQLVYDATLPIGTYRAYLDTWP